MAHEPDHATPNLRRRHIAAVTIGNALEFYDFLTYALFAIQIGRALFPTSTAYGSLMLSLATFGAGFITRPIGGIVLGRYADRVGRKPAMLLCLTMIGASITAMALIPPYAKIGMTAPILAVIARLVQGFSLGGEIGSNTAFLAEAASPERRGSVVSWQAASQLLALIAGNLVGVALTAMLPPALLDAYGWRIALLLGAAAVPFGLWLRTHLPETLEASRPGTGAPAPVMTPARTIGLTPRDWRVIALGLVILSAGTIGTYIFTYIATYAQHALHLSARSGFLAELIGYTVGVPLAVLGGRLSDRYGRRPINVWGNLAFLLGIYPVFSWIVAAPSAGSLIAGVTLLSAAQWFITGSFFAALVEALPAPLRSTGFGTVYSLSIALFGGTTQLVVTWLIHLTGSAIAPAWYLIGATAIGQIAYVLYPETAPVRLRRSTPAAAYS
ncbi:MAG TPA: MFS transporter [Steroidobacteraceae bacterium]|nr:MFS transporter [Steroidobacteraceae bacterium]